MEIIWKRFLGKEKEVFNPIIHSSIFHTCTRDFACYSFLMSPQHDGNRRQERHNLQVVKNIPSISTADYEGPIGVSLRLMDIGKVYWDNSSPVHSFSWAQNYHDDSH